MSSRSSFRQKSDSKSKPSTKKRVRFTLPVDHKHDSDSDHPQNEEPTNNTSSQKFTPAEIALRQNIQCTRDMFLYNYGLPIETMPEMMKQVISGKINDEYLDVKHLSENKNTNFINNQNKRSINEISNTNEHQSNDNPPSNKKQKLQSSTNDLQTMIDNERTQVLFPDVLQNSLNTNHSNTQTQMIESLIDDMSHSNPNSEYEQWRKSKDNEQHSMQNPSSVTQMVTYSNNTRQIAKQLPNKKYYAEPQWHPPWKCYKVISGHLGWVESIAVDHSNEFYCTGSADRTIKIWDLATGVLKLTLTGHISHVRGLALSSKHPYMFSCGEDKQVKCWDLEQNKVIRNYHGHLSGIYCLSLHPTIDVLMTGGRDCSCRVWDIRTKGEIRVLSGHTNTIHSVISQSSHPEIITGSHDRTVRCWDLGTGKTTTILTHHKKAIRSLVLHPRQWTFASAAADNVKVWKFPEAVFLRNFNLKPRSIVECMGINTMDVCVTGHQTGHLRFWDWKTGHNFQSERLDPQPGSLDSEAGICAMSFDVTGTRLITCEQDKTIKMWKEDMDATVDTHPVLFKPSKRTRY